MDFNLSTPALLFPAISLLFLAYTNRFLTLANLIRDLHARYSANPDQILLWQLRSLRYRVQLIKHMQGFGVASLLLCVVSMFALFLGWQPAGKKLRCVLSPPAARQTLDFANSARKLVASLWTQMNVRFITTSRAARTNSWRISELRSRLIALSGRTHDVALLELQSVASPPMLHYLLAHVASRLCLGSLPRRCIHRFGLV